MGAVLTRLRSLPRALTATLLYALYARRRWGLFGLASLSALFVAATRSSHGRPMWRVLLGLGAVPFRTEGTVAPGFERVREAFKANFQAGLENGSQFCVYYRGKKVVDLAGSIEGAGGARRYGLDTLQISMSCTKVLTALCIAVAVADGTLAYEAPIAKYWPKFASVPNATSANRVKEKITIADLMRHDAGLAYLQQPVTREALVQAKQGDPSLLVSNIEKSPCNFPSSTPRCYHSMTRGLICNELLRMTTGLTVASVLRDRLARPLGVDGLHVGTVTGTGAHVAPIRELPIPKIAAQLFAHGLLSKLGIVSPLKPCEKLRVWAALDRQSFMNRWLRTFDKKTIPLHRFNLSWWHEVESPSTNGLCSARGLARVSAMMQQGGTLDGVRVLPAEVVREACSGAVEHLDEGFWHHTANTRGGLTVFQGEDWAPETHGFVGWGGFGGSAIAWHPELELAIGYTHCGMGNPLFSIVGFTDPRCLRLLRAVRACVLKQQLKQPTELTTARL